MGTHYIVEDCTTCGACADVCPEEAIAVGAEMYAIEKETCTDCGDCDEVCPFGAIMWT